MAEEETELEPSGYVTSDGKDLDERYLFLKDKPDADDILDTVIQGIGVLQQNPITSSANPYTLPKDGYVTWYGHVGPTGLLPSQYEDIINTVHFWLNDKEVHSVTSPKGEGNSPTGERIPPSASGTIKMVCKQNDVLKVTSSGNGAAANRKVNQEVSIAPYTLYRFDQIDEILPKD